MLKLKFLIILLFISFFGSVYAQNNFSLINYEEIKIDSKQLNEDRYMAVYLPLEYEKNEHNYPVLYLLDGSAHFQHAVTATKFLSLRGIMPEIIIVAIHNIDRNRDFSPVYFENVPTSGGGEKFLNFLSKELIPTISKKYRTSGYSILFGHSFGGTFATYTLFTKPTLFDAFISVSPYLQFAENYLVKQAPEKLNDSYKKEIKYYMTVGNEPAYFDPISKFLSHIKEKGPENLTTEYIKMPAENHGTVPYISLYNGLKFIFSDWQLKAKTLEKGLKAVDMHYTKLSKKYGLKAVAPENVINLLAYTYLRKGDTDNAIKVFIENVNRYPYSANVYDSLGEAYETVKKYKLAEKNYKKAYDIGSVKLDPNTAIYKRNYERVKSL